MITFEKMSNKEFKSYIEFMIPDYAKDTAEHYLMSMEEANEKAEKQIESLQIKRIQRDKIFIILRMKKDSQATFGFML
ncbi:hypothetical protein ABE41_004965 [Fictibacillus arsenicus]|uniref:Uncharacterized protein n=1 Tax=Fictibacillus arsenicus TaxID=255247 RepID=A0A1B1Z1J2_9BACL|nr:hypothetical protein [Fictibacillus arsenicus]ANX11348.1 hypothetical protein ABE41_004965 [Fictibacillus arsenicus]